MILMSADFGNIQFYYTIIAHYMMVWAQNKNITRNVRPIMRTTKWLNMVCF